jgi:hypothetical protein
MFCWKEGAPTKADGLTSWWTGMVYNTMLSFSAGCFSRMFFHMSDRGAGRYLSQSSNVSPLESPPLEVFVMEEHE